MIVPSFRFLITKVFHFVDCADSRWPRHPCGALAASRHIPKPFYLSTFSCRRRHAAFPSIHLCELPSFFFVQEAYSPPYSVHHHHESSLPLVKIVPLTGSSGKKWPSLQGCYCLIYRRTFTKVVSTCIKSSGQNGAERS